MGAAGGGSPLSLRIADPGSGTMCTCHPKTNARCLGFGTPSGALLAPLYIIATNEHPLADFLPVSVELTEIRRRLRPSTCSRCCRVPQPWPADAKSASKKLSPSTTTGPETPVRAIVLSGPWGSKATLCGRTLATLLHIVTVLSNVQNVQNMSEYVKVTAIVSAICAISLQYIHNMVGEK